VTVCFFALSVRGEDADGFSAENASWPNKKWPAEGTREIQWFAAIIPPTILSALVLYTPFPGKSCRVHQS